jgi:hypothetical protein
MLEVDGCWVWKLKEIVLLWNAGMRLGKVLKWIVQVSLRFSELKKETKVFDTE